MKCFTKEVIISMILSILLIFMLSIVISKTSLSENIVIPASIGIVSISLMIGSYRIAKNKKEKGILNGVILGIIYMLILYLISSIINFNFTLSMNSLIMIIIGIIGGAIGGILGVNF